MERWKGFRYLIRKANCGVADSKYSHRDGKKILCNKIMPIKSIHYKPVVKGLTLELCQK